jgi:putative transposase
MIAFDHALPIVRQCQLLGIARSTVRNRPKAVNDVDEDLMKRIDALHLALPFFGSCRIGDALADERRVVNRERVQRLVRLMGLAALYPRPRTTKPAPGHRICSYLLRELTIDRPNQVWCADITYLPMARGFLYLVAVMDWHSRKVSSWRLSNTMDEDFCVEALEATIAGYGVPEIFNTDQGSQFAGTALTGVLKREEIQISMDGRGRWMDSVLIERVWRSLKYEEDYLKAYDNGRQTRAGLRAYFDFYNAKRNHHSLDRQTSDQVYFNPTPLPQAG